MKAKLKVVTIGELLLRLSPPSQHLLRQANQLDVFYGGSEANAAIALSQWGFEALHVSALPDNELGKAAFSHLKAYGVNTSYVFFGDGRLGIYFLENGAMQRASKIVYDRFASTFANYSFQVNWDEVFKDCNWFHYSGITPAISPTALQLTNEAVFEAHKRGIMVSGDINYRRNLWGYGVKPQEVMPELVSKTSVLVGGTEDFANCLGIRQVSFQEGCREVFNLYPEVKTVASTFRTTHSASENSLKGVLVTRKKTTDSKEYRFGPIVDRIGAGDAFMAGLICKLAIGNVDDAIHFAVAASVLKHSIPGDALISSVEDIEKLVSGENIGALLR